MREVQLVARRPAEESSSRKAKQSAPFRRAMKTLRTRVKDMRRMHGLSYDDLAKRSGVNWRQLVAIENGEPINPTLVTLTRLAHAFGIEVHELLVPAQSGVRRKQVPSAEESTNDRARKAGAS